MVTLATGSELIALNARSPWGPISVTTSKRWSCSLTLTAVKSACPSVWVAMGSSGTVSFGIAGLCTLKIGK
jgi:hypothetical protein